MEKQDVEDKEGTASKSLALTYSQLKFLGREENASAWVRGAIDQAMRVDSGELNIVKIGHEQWDFWSRLIELGIDGQAGRGRERPWSEIFELTLAAMSAYERSRSEEGAEKADTRFLIPLYQVVRDLRKISSVFPKD